MGVLKEFKEFVSRGNVVDLAVGVIIGGAFQKIISSLVSDIIMPPLGFLIGGIKFTEYKWILRNAITDASGKIISEPVSVNTGTFLQTVLDFLIIALAVFLAVKTVNRFNKKKKDEVGVEPTNQEKLLIEIRDLLKQK